MNKLGGKPFNVVFPALGFRPFYVLAATHVLTVGAIGGLMLAMMTRIAD